MMVMMESFLEPMISRLYFTPLSFFSLLLINIISITLSLQTILHMKVFELCNCLTRVCTIGRR